ncbi:MAG TPA: endonuclease III [Gemmataceae bacterium]|nr:endonuclease III [Gemmataceae bacterium]
MSVSQGHSSLPTIIAKLRTLYPNPRYELNWENPLQLLVATILAAQCTDERVNSVTPRIFAKYPDASAYARADIDELTQELLPINLTKDKATAIQGACQSLIDNFGGKVPADMDSLLTLPRVARKTANVVLTNAFKQPSGIVVDSHVARVSQRLGLSKQKKPEKIEKDLMEMVPKSDWIFFGGAMVLHGRYTCTASEPNCNGCVLKDLCPRIGVDEDDA